MNLPNAPPPPGMWRRSAPTLIVLCTLVIFFIDLYFPLSLVPWVPYLVLAIAVSRLYPPRVLLLAVVFWSLAIMGEPLLPPHSGEDIVQGLVNRTIGMLTLWILAGFLFFDAGIRRDRQDREDQLRAIVRGALDAVVTIDHRGLVVEWNPQAETIFGHSREESVGKLLADLIIPERYREAHARGMQRLLATGQEQMLRRRIEITALRKSGEELPVELTVLPLHLGEQTLFSSFIRDITERHQAEAALVKARQAAEEASKAKSDFLANISHEMRSPLNAIVGLADVLMHTPLSEEQHSLVRRCAQASDSLLRMIEELLLAAKAESGTLELVEAPFMIADIVAGCRDLLATDVREKGLSLTIALAPRIPAHVVGDAQRLQQVLLNLLRNAVKFTATGSITVEAIPVSLERDCAVIQFTVIDTGSGIPTEQQQRIFERFYQADSCTARQHGGVGLGLSICKQLVEMMGGRIWVDSTPADGSTFSFTVRLAVPPNGDLGIPRLESDEPVSQVDQPGLRSLPDQGLHILLAEDSLESQDIMRLYLRHTPHRLDCAATGSEVLARFKAGRYDVVFMDLHMPDMDGLAACRKIREDGRFEHLPVIVVTAKTEGTDITAAYTAGATDYIHKPVVPAELVARVSMAMTLKEEFAARTERERELSAQALALGKQVHELKTLQGTLSVCAKCKRVKTSSGFWQRLEDSLEEAFNATISSGTCTRCTSEQAPRLSRLQ